MGGAKPLSGRVEFVISKADSKGKLSRRGVIEAKHDLRSNFPVALHQIKKELIAVHTLNMRAGVGGQRTYGALTDGYTLIIVCFDAGEHYNAWAPHVLRDLTGTFTSSRAFDIGLDNLLGKAVNRPSKDLILGMDCLLHAFAPELAGKTIKQVSEWVGQRRRKTSKITSRALKMSLNELQRWAQDVNLEMAGKQPRMLEDELLQGVKGTEHVEGENSKAGQLDKRQKVDEGTSLGMQDIPAHVEHADEVQEPEDQSQDLEDRLQLDNVERAEVEKAERLKAWGSTKHFSLAALRARHVALLAEASEIAKQIDLG